MNYIYVGMKFWWKLLWNIVEKFLNFESFYKIKVSRKKFNLIAYRENWKKNKNDIKEKKKRGRKEEEKKKLEKGICNYFEKVSMK